MIAWYWLPISVIITAALTLLAFGLLKSGSRADEWHNGFAAGAGWTKEADK